MNRHFGCPVDRKWQSLRCSRSTDTRSLAGQLVDAFTSLVEATTLAALTGLIYPSFPIQLMKHYTCCRLVFEKQLGRFRFR